MKIIPQFKFANTPSDRVWWLTVVDKKTNHSYKVEQFFAITRTSGEAYPGTVLWKLIIGPFCLILGVNR